MIKNSVYYELFASVQVPNHEEVGYWIDLGADAHGNIIKFFDKNINRWVKLTDASSEYATPPYIGNNGNWFIENRDSGISAVGKNPYIGDNRNWFVFDASQNKYIDSGIVAKGLSAYEIAVKLGYTGTETEWLESLKQPALDAADKALEAADNANAATDAAKLAIANAEIATEDAHDAADRSNEIANNPPKIVNEEWYMYDELTKEYKSTGIKAIGNAFTIVKTYVSIEAMEADYNNPEVGIGQFVMIDTGNVEDPEDSQLYLKGDIEWKFISDLSGMQGIQGLSAYQVAVQNGYIGTEKEWVQSLKQASLDAAKEALDAKAAIELVEASIKVAETTRVTNETDRVQKESIRVTNENQRKANETDRQSTENKRVSVEATRVTSEEARKFNETARVNAEGIRDDNENVRKIAESARVTSESSRFTAEQSRIANETSRKTNETGRIDEETKRVEAENTRNSAEASRLLAETTRGEKEVIREASEAVRETQEDSRQTNTANAINAVNAAKTDAEAATTSAITAANLATDKAELATEAALHQPIIKNGTWWTYRLADLPAGEGLWIYAESGKFYTKDEWIAKTVEDTPIGVYGQNADRSISAYMKSGEITGVRWNPIGENKIVGAKDRFDGVYNTNKIVEAYPNVDSTNCSALRCKEKGGYLPAVEEYRFFNKTGTIEYVNELFTIINATKLLDSGVYHTSTEGSVSKVYGYYVNSETEDLLVDKTPYIFNVLTFYKLSDKVYIDTGIPATGDSGKSPMIKDSTWWIYNNTTGEYENTGVSVSSDYELTKDKVENVLTGDITTHNHNTVYYSKEEVDASIKGVYYLYDPNAWVPSETLYIELQNAIKRNIQVIIKGYGTEYHLVSNYYLVEDNLIELEYNDGHAAFKHTILPNNSINITRTDLATEDYVDEKIASSASKGYILTITNGTVAVDAAQKILDAYNNGEEIYVKYTSTETLYKPVKIDVSGTNIILYLLNLKEVEGNNYTVIELTVGNTTIETYGKNVVNIADRLDSQSTSFALSANQGKLLNESKVDKITGKGLSTNDYTTVDKDKLTGIAAGAEVNVLSDWNATSGDAQILNKPIIPSKTSQLTKDDVYTKTETNEALSTKVNSNLIGVVDGIAQLDTTGKVPSSQLPSYVDDVLEYASVSVFPITGETGKIYVAVDKNITYRWSGTAYVEISASLALGETSSTAYPGDKGKANATKLAGIEAGAQKNTVTSVAGKTGVVTLSKTDVGLNSVDNTADSIKSVNSASKLTVARNINGIPFDGTKDIALEVGINDAPADGKTYGRKDKIWSEVVDSPPEVHVGTDTPTGNETVWIDTDDTELFDDYAVPEAPIDDKQYARKNKGWVVVELIPLGETVLIKLNSNQTQPDDALNGAIIHVLYSNVDDTFTWQGQDITATIPVNITYQVACPTINGYKKPEDVEYMALAGNTRSVSFTYNTQKTTINVTADDGASVAEQTLTVTDVSDSTILYEGAAGTVVVNIPLATEYRVSVNDKAGYTPVEDQTLTASDASKTVEVVYEKIKVNYITLDQNISDPTGMITGDVNGIIIQNIRNNSHRYLGKFTASKNITICQIKDDDGTKYSDGTAAILTGDDGDVFMRLPKFYYKATEVSTDVWKVGFALQQLDSTWKEWDGNDLIGVYEAYNSGTKIYSRSGVASTGNVSQSNFKAYARNRGDGYTLVKHKHQNIMAFLFYAMYGNTNAQAVCGLGTDSYEKETGQTNLLGMVDTKAKTNGNTMSINFWGLENWWGNKYEWEDNVLENPTADNGVWRITEDDGSTRDVQGATSNGFPKKMIIGEHLDTIVKEYGASETTGFCDYQRTSGSGTAQVVMRSSNNAYTNCGIVYAYASYNSSYTLAPFGSRLAFRGDITEASSVTAFKALPIIN